MEDTDADQISKHARQVIEYLQARGMVGITFNFHVASSAVFSTNLESVTKSEFIGGTTEIYWVRQEPDASWRCLPSPLTEYVVIAR